MINKKPRRWIEIVANKRIKIKIIWENLLISFLNNKYKTGMDIIVARPLEYIIQVVPAISKFDEGITKQHTNATCLLNNSLPKINVWKQRKIPKYKDRYRTPEVKLIPNTLLNVAKKNIMPGSMFGGYRPK